MLVMNGRKSNKIIKYRKSQMPIRKSRRVGSSLQSDWPIYLRNNACRMVHVNHLPVNTSIFPIQRHGYSAVDFILRLKNFSEAELYVLWNKHFRQNF